MTKALTLAGVLAVLATAALAAAAPSPLVFERRDVPSANVGEFSEGFAVGDLDGDGRPELLAGSYSDASIHTLGWQSDPRGDADSDGVVTDADLDAGGNYTGGSVAFTNVTTLMMPARTGALLLTP